MKAKVILNDSEICKEYVNSEDGIETLALKHHVGKKRIREILTRNNIPLKKSGNQGFKYEYVVADYHTEKYPEPVNMTHYVVYDKKTGFESTDIGNRGGILTSYIEQEYGIPTPSLHERQMYYRRTGNYWWEQWLKVKLVKDKETKKCPYCDWTTTDLDNKSGAFEVHLRNDHNMTVKEHLEKHPEDNDYFRKFNRLTQRLNSLNDIHNYVICPICGERFGKLNETHTRFAHKMDWKEFKEKYPDTKIVSDSLNEKNIENYKLSNLNLPKNRFISKYERQIQDFLDCYNIKYEANRQILIGREIDILIPSLKIGIEFNGLKFHSEFFGKKDRMYHLNKTRECNAKGYSLIHIFEDEFVLHEEIVFEKLKHILHIGYENYPKIYACKCVIKEIYKNEAMLFLEKYHIQGFVSSTLYLGAYYNDELVSVMTFKLGNMKSPEWELTRFASKSGYIYCGIGGKMFKYFVKKFNPIIVYSYADRRWTLNKNENLYTKLGFELDSETPPDYTYYNERVDRYRRFHKFGFRKQILHKKYGLPLTMTETEMTRELGYDRVWNCGLFKYVWKKKD